MAVEMTQSKIPTLTYGEIRFRTLPSKITHHLIGCKSTLEYRLNSINQFWLVCLLCAIQGQVFSFLDSKLFSLRPCAKDRKWIGIMQPGHKIKVIHGTGCNIQSVLKPEGRGQSWSIRYNWILILNVKNILSYFRRDLSWMKWSPSLLICSSLNPKIIYFNAVKG